MKGNGLLCVQLTRIATNDPRDKKDRYKVQPSKKGLSGLTFYEKGLYILFHADDVRITFGQSRSNFRIVWVSRLPSIDGIPKTMDKIGSQASCLGLHGSVITLVLVGIYSAYGKRLLFGVLCNGRVRAGIQIGLVI